MEVTPFPPVGRARAELLENVYGPDVRLGDAIGRFASRVEIAIAGLDDRLREGEEALARGDAMRARTAAHALLAGLPGQPLALALLADACEAAGLDAEAHLTLEELAMRAPSRAEVWLRLGRARARTGSSDDDVRDAFVRALAVAEPGSEERTRALVELADLDLRQGDGPRADRTWGCNSTRRRPRCSGGQSAASTLCS